MKIGGWRIEDRGSKIDARRLASLHPRSSIFDPSLRRSLRSLCLCVSVPLSSFLRVLLRALRGALAGPHDARGALLVFFERDRRIGVPKGEDEFPGGVGGAELVAA